MPSVSGNSKSTVSTGGWAQATSVPGGEAEGHMDLCRRDKTREGVGSLALEHFAVIVANLIGESQDPLI